MSKKTNKKEGIIPEKHNVLVIEATEKLVADLEEKLLKARQTLDYLRNGCKEPEIEKPKFKWTKLVIGAMEELGFLAETHTIYNMAIHLNRDELLEHYEKRIVTSRLSSAISQLKSNDAIVMHENQRGNKIYGLNEWYINGHLDIIDRLGKFKEQIDSYNIVLYGDDTGEDDKQLDFLKT